MHSRALVVPSRRGRHTETVPSAAAASGSAGDAHASARTPPPPPLAGGGMAAESGALPAARTSQASTPPSAPPTIKVSRVAARQVTALPRRRTAAEATAAAADGPRELLRPARVPDVDGGRSGGGEGGNEPGRFERLQARDLGADGVDGRLEGGGTVVLRAHDLRRRRHVPHRDCSVGAAADELAMQSAEAADAARCAQRRQRRRPRQTPQQYRIGAGAGAGGGGEAPVGPERLQTPDVGRAVDGKR